MTPRRDHPALLQLTAVASISLLIPSSANTAGGERDTGHPKKGLPTIRQLYLLSLEESRQELAKATSVEATAWVLKAAVTGIVHEDCELKVDVVPNGKRGQFALSLTMSLRPGTEKSLLTVLDNTLGGLASLGFRNYSAKQTLSRDAKLSYRAILLKPPVRR